MTIKPEVLAAIKTVRKHFDLSMDDETCDAWQTIRAELLAMDARLSDANALLHRTRTTHYDAAERICLYADIEAHLSEPRP